MNRLRLLTAALNATVLIVITAAVIRDAFTGNLDAFWWQLLALLGHSGALTLALTDPTTKETP